MNESEEKTASPTESYSDPGAVAGKTQLDENKWAMIAHLSTFAGLVFPLGNILAPFLLWSFKKEESEVIERHSKAALNFQISVTIYILMGFILSLFVVGIFVIIAVAILDIVAVVRAAVAANEGDFCNYPLSINFVK